MAEIDPLNPDLAAITLGFEKCMDGNRTSLESMMDRLKVKAIKDPKSIKSWGEMCKALRIAVTDKRNLLDTVERSGVQKVLDTLQKSIKVTSLQSMVERLDSITRQQGLKFTRQSGTHCFISSGIFYVEILLELSGEVEDVKIAHGELPVSCPELTKVLRSGNFTEFTKHLEGLSAIYQLNMDSSNQLDTEAQKLRKEAYAALCYLEHDLSQLWQLQRSIKVSNNLVHRSPVGILQERQGGYSMKLTYFVSPYDLLDIKTRTLIPLTVDTVIEKGLGRSVTVCIESSNTHKLQTASLVTVPKNGEKSLPSFAAPTDLNSTALPVSFVLKLQKPMPMSVSILKKIQGVTKISNCADMSNSQPLLVVIINDASNGKIDGTSQERLFVTLPDQHQCYNMKSNSDLKGVLVSTIPFTHPTHVPQILDALRQQMLFNTVISSCVRPQSKKDLESALKFDIHAYSTNHIQVTFVHPLDESLAAVDLDLKDITSIKCNIHTLGVNDFLCTDEYASKVMQRCLSIPITMRAVIRKAQGQQQQKKQDHIDLYCNTVGGNADVSYLPQMPNYSNTLTNGSSLSSGNFSHLASRICTKPMEQPEAKTSAESTNTAFAAKNENLTPTLPVPVMEVEQQSTAETHQDTASDKGGGKEHSTDQQLPQSGNGQRKTNAILMTMLKDVPSGAPPSTSFPLGTKPRKRKNPPDDKGLPMLGKSPKRKMSEDDAPRDRMTPDSLSADSSSAASASNSNSLPASFNATNLDPHHMMCTPPSAETYSKNEASYHGYPQRSISTDSYLSFRQVININEKSNPELSGIASHVQRIIAGSVESLDNDKLMDSNMDNSLRSNQSLSEKTGIEKNLKKVKKLKDSLDNRSDSQEVLYRRTPDLDSSEGSSSSDFFHKSSTNAESCQPEDVAASGKVAHFAQPIIFNTSLKIAKSGEGHKLAKLELKSKQREGKKSLGDSSSNKKRSEGKKERKKKQTQGENVVVNRLPSQQLHSTSDSSLMPPPANSSEALSIPIGESSPKRPITLNVKASPPSSLSKSPVLVSSSSTSPSSSKNSLSKGTSDKPNIKRTAHASGMGRVVNSEGHKDGTKMVLNTSLKMQSKHKQSPSGKMVGHGSGQSPGRTRPNTQKLKNSNVPHLSSATTMSPAFAKAITQMAASMTVSPVLIDDSLSPTGKQASGGSKSNKSLLRSSKGTLSAVIDKLKATKTTQQLPDSLKSLACGLTLECKDFKLERKENVRDSKEVLPSKSNESKKYCGSEFTVKQSSGIKLTVTKTRLTEGSSKSNRPRTLSSKSVVSGSANANKSVSPSHVASKKAGNMSPVSAKKSSHQVTTSPHGNPSKAVRSGTGTPPSKTVTSHKTISGSANAACHKILSPNIVSKSLSSSSKVANVPQQTKKKIIPLSEPSLVSQAEILDKGVVALSALPSKLAVTPPPTKTQPELWPPIAIPKLNVEPRLVIPQDTIDELDRKKAFRMLLEQSKMEGQNGSELATTKPLDFGPKLMAVTDLEPTDFSVSSSTDIKRFANVARMEQEIAAEQSSLLSSESKPSTENAVSKKHDATLNLSVVSSYKDIKPFNAYPVPSNTNECTNDLNEIDSSPEDGLVIDYPDTPRVHTAEPKRNFPPKKEKSPELNKDRIEVVVMDDRSEKFEYEKSPFIGKSPESLCPSTSNHTPSPSSKFWIDDDLMNMALTGK